MEIIIQSRQGKQNVKIVHESKNMPLARTELHFGDVNVSDYVYMFKKMQFHNHQNLGYEQLPKALSKDYDTESTWSVCRECREGVPGIDPGE